MVFQSFPESNIDVEGVRGYGSLRKHAALWRQSAVRNSERSDGRVGMSKWIVAAVLAVVAGVPDAFAQTYPSRPVTLIAPFPAGGPLDSIARVIAEPMREALGQPVVIENVPGAGGNLGVGRAARAEPDGYTIVIGQWSTHVVNPVTYSLNYDVQELEPIGLLTITPQLIIARKDFPAKAVSYTHLTLPTNREV